MTKSDAALGAAAAFALFVCLAALGNAVQLREPHGAVAQVLSDGGRLNEGIEVVAVLVTASHCGPSRTEGLPDAVRRVREAVSAEAAAAGKEFASIAVSLDQSAVVGLEFLARFGPFEEVTIGRGWLNTGSLQYVVRDSPGELALPQLIILERHIVAESTSLEVSRDYVLARYIGVEEIMMAAADTDVALQHGVRSRREGFHP